MHVLYRTPVNLTPNWSYQHIAQFEPPHTEAHGETYASLELRDSE